MMRSVCLIHYTVGPLGKPAFHSFIQQTFDVDLLINRALLGPGRNKRSRGQRCTRISAGLGNDLTSKTSEKQKMRGRRPEKFQQKLGKHQPSGPGAYRRMPPPGWREGGPPPGPLGHAAPAPRPEQALPGPRPRVPQPDAAGLRRAAPERPPAGR